MIGRVSDRVSSTTLSTISRPVALAPPRRRRLPLTAYALLLPSGGVPARLHLLAGAAGRCRVADGARVRRERRIGASATTPACSPIRISPPPFANNLVYAAGTIIPSLTLALLFALGLRESTRLTSVLRTLFVLPLLIPLVAAAVAVHLHLPARRRAAGLLPGALRRWPQTNWLGDPSLALGSIIAITVWKNTGYYMLFFLAGLAGMPQELLDAAKIDGASAWQRFRRVTLPLLGPTLAFVLVIALLNVLTQVDHVIVMTQGGPSDATLAAAVLHLPAGASELRSRPGLGGDGGQRGVPVRAVGRLAAHLERGIHYEA